jgi:hypothetical protein
LPVVCKSWYWGFLPGVKRPGCEFEHSPPSSAKINPLNAELNPICHLLALLGAHPILHVSRIRVNSEWIYSSTQTPIYLHEVDTINFNF